MLQSIVLIGSEQLGLQDLEQILTSKWDVERFTVRGKQELQIRDRWHSWYVQICDFQKDTDLLEEYLDDDSIDDDLKTKLIASVFFVVRYDDITACKAILLDILKERDLFVDTTFGEMISGRVFRNHLVENPDYDWRHHTL